MDPRYLELLCCPDDRGELVDGSDHLRCERCGRSYPVRANLVSFLEGVELSPLDERERASRDQEAVWYHGTFADYTNAVEVPAMLERLEGIGAGPVLDHGAGTGRITGPLAAAVDGPVVALDYSLASLELLQRHCAGLDVLAVHADGRQLPIRDGVLVGAVSAEVYEHFRAADRRRVLDEFARVLRTGAPLSLSNLNFNLTFRLWRRLGNSGAKEGEHLFGSDFYYLRMTPSELRRELEAVFSVEEVSGIRNIPARSLASLVGRIHRGLGERLLDAMTRRGHKVDRWLERTPAGRYLGFFLVARARRR
ncbi:MAG: methyltransferase domain-containing protein [Acidimicrobiia bacterium]|nr:methyltransferase domain-containing protein [Acidimicrobiia bacterium]